ncbi:putative alpha/beta superfamily hydrolase [Cladophialophora carrionii]|uniref:Putative alpha/beta superfamily hydrolase n=1 Tax=Cladophialophora carrionii TaxID=86049 RepID=A0A1C1CGY8_9EURO|nr:putative alpha/beta superfamily hydrolase [Cladophialophora carrionii]
MVIFQNKIIYMPSVPPFSRSERVDDYAAQCRPVEWVERDLTAADGTALKLLEGSIVASVDSDVTEHVVVIYFQGNASSLPPRLPYLSNILKRLARDHPGGRKYTIVALSYRGYWKSKGSASQAGIELDAEAALTWVQGRYDRGRTKIVVWGQSIGAGVASVSLANLLRNGQDNLRRFSGLILETPFVDLKRILVALYPQRFLPYRYLTPFLRSTWDTRTALRRLGASKPTLKVLILEAGNDEVVPPGQAETLEGVCIEEQLEVDRKMVPGALHTEVMVKGQGQNHIVKFVQSI